MLVSSGSRNRVPTTNIEIECCIAGLPDTCGRVCNAADGGQAGIGEFCAALSRGTPFQAVVTGMPNIDGGTVAAAIESRAPDTPVPLLTGWGYRLRAENDLPQHVDRVLSKPPKVYDLRAALLELTGAAASLSQAYP